MVVAVIETMTKLKLIFLALLMKLRVKKGHYIREIQK